MSGSVSLGGKRMARVHTGGKGGRVRFGGALPVPSA